MADDLKARFEAASVADKGLSKKPSDDDLLTLYALITQGTEGDVAGSKPGMFDFVKRAKFEAWEGLQGTSKEDAMERYIAKVEELGA